MTRFLSSGSYGCVYKPAIGCYSRSYDGPHVSKLFAKGGHPYTDLGAFDEEMRNNRIVKEINADNEFTITNTDNCFISGDALTDAEKEECVETASPSKRDMVRQDMDFGVPQIVYPYGGIPLSRLHKQAPDVSLPVFLLDLQAITRGLLKLEKNRKAHFDIKPSNILYNLEKPRKMALMDFGLLQSETWYYTKPCEKSNLQLLAHPYPYYPPEFKIVARFCSDEFHIDDPDLFYKVDPSLIPIFSQHHRRKPDLMKRVRAFQEKIDTQLPSPDFARQYKEVLSRFHYRTRERCIEGFLERLKKTLNFSDMSYTFPKLYSMMTEFKKNRFGAKVDTYSMGITLLEVLADVFLSRPLNSFSIIAHEVLIALLCIISGMVHPDPYLRLTAKQTSDLYDDLVRAIVHNRDDRTFSETIEKIKLSVDNRYYG